VKVQVIDKETGKLRWEETHPTSEAANKVIKEMKENWFNPDYFKFLLSLNRLSLFTTVAVFGEGLKF
jgi:hypothetical protein